MPFPMRKNKQFSHYKIWKLKDGTTFKAVSHGDACRYAFIVGVPLATNE